jgi:hypothetical protein
VTPLIHATNITSLTCCATTPLGQVQFLCVAGLGTGLPCGNADSSSHGAAADFAISHQRKSIVRACTHSIGKQSLNDHVLSTWNGLIGVQNLLLLLGHILDLLFLHRDVHISCNLQPGFNAQLSWFAEFVSEYWLCTVALLQTYDLARSRRPVSFLLGGRHAAEPVLRVHRAVTSTSVVCTVPWLAFQMLRCPRMRCKDLRSLHVKTALSAWLFGILGAERQRTSPDHMERMLCRHTVSKRCIVRDCSCGTQSSSSQQ